MISHSNQETTEYAHNFAQKLRGSEVIGLVGDLGAGKTTFVQGLAEALGVGEKITSPTFVILKNYCGKIKDKRINFIHIDAYRVGTQDDIKSVGITDYFGRTDCLMVIEWAEKIRDLLPKDTIYIEFKHINENEREIVDDTKH